MEENFEDTDKTTTILEDETGYYRFVSGTRIDTNVNGDWYIKIPLILYNRSIPLEIKTLILENFTMLEDITYFSDIYKLVEAVDSDVIIKAGIYNCLNYRLTKTTDLEAQLTISIFGFDTIFDYVPQQFDI